MKPNQRNDEPRPSGSDQAMRPHAKPPIRHAAVILALVALLGLLPNTPSQADTVLTGGKRLGTAELVACDLTEASRTCTLRVDGQPIATTDLVRWGEPAPVERRTAVVLADGSRLLSDRDWSPIGLARIDAQTVRLRRGKLWAEFPRDTVRWVILDAEAADLRLELLTGESGSESQDQVLLSDGDRLVGRVDSLESGKLTVTVGEEPVETPLESVAAVRLAGEPLSDNAVCLVGLSDGSLLRATGFRLAEGDTEIEVATTRIGAKAGTLSFIQPLGGRTRYLSDLEAVDYRHTPYLDLAWPYTRDTNLRGGPLAGGGVRRGKGLAMHSAARLVYRLDGSPQRFSAEVAVGDPPAGSSVVGSVVFRVYLVKDGAFVPAFDSGIVRAGDPAEPIDLDATDAAAIALVVDYADNGDAGDEALWLDARLEPTADANAG